MSTIYHIKNNSVSLKTIRNIVSIISGYFIYLMSKHLNYGIYTDTSIELNNCIGARLI